MTLNKEERNKKHKKRAMDSTKTKIEKKVDNNSIYSNNNNPYKGDEMNTQTSIDNYKKELNINPMSENHCIKNYSCCKPTVHPYMDTFYGLSSSNFNERAHATTSLLQYIFYPETTKSDSESKKKKKVQDAKYTFKRLMTGLCSDRENSRQGYASCLTAFLKLSFEQKGPYPNSKTSIRHSWIEQILLINNFSEEKYSDKKTLHCCESLRRDLLVYTSTNEYNQKSGRKPKKDEKNSKLGLLFGILAIIRSGILLHFQYEIDDTSNKILEDLLKDLMDLYEYNTWMKEAVIIGMMELFTSISILKSCKIIATNVLVPFLSLNNNINLNNNWSAEKIALYLHLQLLFNIDTKNIPPKFYQKNIFSMFSFENPDDTISTMTRVLCDTSLSVFANNINPNSPILFNKHVVWDSIWNFFTISIQSNELKNSGGNITKSLVQTKLRDKLPIGNTKEYVEEIFLVFINAVIRKGLLWNDNTSSNNLLLSYKRQILALSFLQKICCQLLQPCSHFSMKVLEQCLLHVDILEKIFIPILSQEDSNSKKKDIRQYPSILKYLVQRILKSIVNISLSKDNKSREKYDNETNTPSRLAIVCILLKADPLFDSKTKTHTVSLLLGLEYASIQEEKKMKGSSIDEEKHSNDVIYTIWKGYMEFLSSQISIKCFTKHFDLQEISHYVDLLYLFAKRTLRISHGIQRKHILQYALGFFIVGSCLKLNNSEQRFQHFSPLKQTEIQQQHLFIISAHHWYKKFGENGKATTIIPFSIRKLMSSRFHSLLSDAISVMSSINTFGNKVQSKRTKSQVILDLLPWIIQGYQEIERIGAVVSSVTILLTNNMNITDRAVMDDKNKLSHYVVKINQWYDNLSNRLKKLEDKNPEKNALSGITLLVISLYLQILIPVKNQDDKTDIIDEETLFIVELIHEMVSVLFEVSTQLQRFIKDTHSEKQVINHHPLFSLATVCVNILRCPIGGSDESSSRGGGAKLVRDCVKIAWVSCLSIGNLVKSMTDDTSYADHIMNILLESVCDLDVMELKCNFNTYEKMSGEIESDSGNKFSSDTLSQTDADSINYRDSGTRNLENIKHDSNFKLDTNTLLNSIVDESDVEKVIGDDDILEHHYGAYTAFSQLIKIKQGSTINSKVITEKKLISNRLRCFTLLESLHYIIKRLKQPNVSNQVLLRYIRPLLNTRRLLEMSITSVNGFMIEEKQPGGYCVRDKYALSEKITLLLQNIYKTPLDGCASCDDCSKLASHVMDEARKSCSATHSSVCSLALMFIVKAVSNSFDNAVAVTKNIFTCAVKEWSSERSNKLSSQIFDDLTLRHPDVARTVILKPLAISAKDAHSAYLKSESFRLLANLYHFPSKKPYTENFDLTNIIDYTPLIEESLNIISAIRSAIEDDILLRPKHMKEILKVTEKLLTFSSLVGNNTTIFDAFTSLKSSLHKIVELGTSNGMKSLSNRLLEIITERSKSSQSAECGIINKNEKKIRKRKSNRVKI